MKQFKGHIIFIATIFVLSLFFLNSVLHKGVMLDNIHYINDLSFVSFNTKESLKNNELPLWTPYFYSGSPLIAIPENYMFDMNFLMIYLFNDVNFAMKFSLVFYLFLAGLGMYLLVHNLVDNRKAAFLSAIIYMFNGFMHSFIITGHLVILQGYSLIPFIFLFVHKALKSSNWIFYSILAGVFFALQITSGSMILFFYTVLIIFLYAAFNLITKNFVGALLKSAIVGLIIAVTAFGLASIKLLPVLEFTKMSSRADKISFAEYTGEPIKISNIARILVTNIGYNNLSAAIGIIGMILLVFSLFNYKKKLIIFSFALIIFSLLFASGTFLADVMYKVPGFDKLRHVERALLLISFAGSILAAYGFIALSEKLTKLEFLSKHQNLFFGLIISLMLLELLLLQNVPISTKIIEPKDIEVLDYMSKDNSFFRSFNFAQKDVIGAAGYNYYVQRGISEAKGGGGIWVNDYAAFLSIAQQSLNTKLFSVLNVKYIVSDKKLDANNITLIERFKPCKECPVSNAFGPYLYKNDKFVPRYYAVPNSMLIVGNKALVKQIIYNFMFQNFEPENTVLVEGTKINDYDIGFLKKFNIIFLVRDSVDQNSIDKLKEYAANGGKIVPDILNRQSSVSSEDINVILNKTTGNYTEIKISQYSNNKVVLDLNGEKGWLAASERFAYFPGWKASVNGKNVELLKADNAITALYLDGEKGKLVFEYKPYSYRKGKLISLAAFLIIIIYFAYYVYAKNET